MHFPGIYQKPDSKIYYYRPLQQDGYRPAPINLRTKDEQDTPPERRKPVDPRSRNRCSVRTTPSETEEKGAAPALRIQGGCRSSSGIVAKEKLTISAEGRAKRIMPDFPLPGASTGTTKPPAVKDRRDEKNLSSLAENGLQKPSR